MVPVSNKLGFQAKTEYCVWQNDTIKIKIYIPWVVIVILENDYKSQPFYSRKKFPLKFEHVSQPLPGEFIQGRP
jgi:hypothetical protein